MVKIYIDPRCQILYSAYYILGLWQKYGRKNVKFSSKYFKDFQYKGRQDYDQFFAFVIISERKAIKKFIVDYGDKDWIRESAYEWTDVYAKININFNTERKKLLSIPPSFGIKIYSRRQSIFFSLSNVLKCAFNLPIPLRTFLGSYKACNARGSIEDYRKEEDSSGNYVFFVSTLWDHEMCIVYTNPLRYSFMKAAKKSADQFEGGFFSTKNNIEYEKYKDMVFDTYIDPSEYLRKVKKSMYVFNTPAVHNCHGWKLGEYLAMGKVIISTPIGNKLPVDLRNNEDVLIVNSSEDIEKAIIALKDSNFREKLSENSYTYFEKYVSPLAVIESITSFGSTT